jgi:hypothetical protein
MKTIQPLYRSTYIGERVNDTRDLTSGAWTSEQITIPPSQTASQYGTKALVIGNGESRRKFNLEAIKHHKNGVPALGALQTYGCNALHRDFRPNFLVVTRPEILNEVMDSNYTAANIVYANRSYVSADPTRLYYIPQDPCWNSGAMAAYMACFDGHAKVYLVGFDGVDTPTHSYNLYQDTNGYPELKDGYNEAFYVQTMLQVFNTYPDVDFVRVKPTDSFRLPEEWKWAPNLRQIDFNQFVNEVDL